MNRDIKLIEDMIRDFIREYETSYYTSLEDQIILADNLKVLGMKHRDLMGSYREKKIIDPSVIKLHTEIYTNSFRLTTAEKLYSFKIYCIGILQTLQILKVLEV
ncbi:MAG: hypothetical protein ACRCZ9_03190 [Fusobacteriaceae bacterium]